MDGSSQTVIKTSENQRGNTKQEIIVDDSFFFGVDFFAGRLLDFTVRELFLVRRFGCESAASCGRSSFFKNT